MPGLGKKSSKKVFRVGTRGSKLALAQTDWVINQLKCFFPEVVFEKKIIKTTGDKILDSPLSKIGGKGLFVKEIEEALLKEEIDFAVHSMKDVPAQVPQGLEIFCIPKRESPWDVLISEYPSLQELPVNAEIGTSSLRRMAQIKRLRKDLVIKPLRGNVDTRLRKWKQGEFTGIILAEAGIKRLNLQIPQAKRITQIIPAVGQGALGIEVRKEDRETKKILSAIHCENTALCVSAEREFLKVMEGGCQVPLGAYAWINGKSLYIKGFISDLNGERFYEASEQGSLEEAINLGENLAKKLLKMGGEAILKEIYRGVK